MGGTQSPVRVAKSFTTLCVAKMSNKDLGLYDETAGNKFARKAKESPFMIAGLTGLVAACAVGAYKYKHRGAMSTSVFLMQLRVTAQGIAIGSLTLGVMMSMFSEHILHRKPE